MRQSENIHIPVRKIMLPFVLFIFLLAYVSLSQADTFWEMHWQHGENTVKFNSEEDTLITGIIETAKDRSDGTNIRLGADRENDTEYAYEQFLSISPNGTQMEPADSIKYEDIGYYYWAVGIPDDQSISKDEAWEILLKFLIDQKLSTSEDLVHYYPLVSYETGNYSGNPVWRIILECYDYAESNLPFTFCDVAVYAHDGSICGYRLIEPVG